MRTPYQEFKFEPVAAKYLKVKLLNSFGGDSYIGLSEIQVFGALAPAAAAASKPDEPARKQTNILAQANGGEVLAAPSDLWLAVNDGKEGWLTWFRDGEEAVFGFKDDQPVTFDTFTTFIGGTNGNNLKDFELLVGDEGPTGKFRSIGKFTTQNIKEPPEISSIAPRPTRRYTWDTRRLRCIRSSISSPSPRSI